MAVLPESKYEIVDTPYHLEHPEAYETVEPRCKYNRSRFNATRHGLTGQILVLAPEEQSAYDRLCISLKDAYKPFGAIEENLLQGICDTQWRLNRAVSFENSIFAMKAGELPVTSGKSEIDVAFSQAQTFLTRSKEFNLLSTYEGRLHRRMTRDIEALKAAQAQRMAEYKEAMKIAKQLYLQAQAQNKRYKPEDYFYTSPVGPNSVFSPDSVAFEIARDAVQNSGRAPFSEVKKEAA